MNRFFVFAVAAVMSAVAAVSVSGARRALVSMPVACLRGEPRSGGELVSQAVMGTPMLVTEAEGEWWRVTTPDGYEGYMTASSFVEVDSAAVAQMRRFVVTPLAGAIMFDDRGGRVSPLPCGSVVEVRRGRVVLPDGREGYVAPDALTDYDRWTSQPFSAERLVETARALMGAPYLWGGMSADAMDCSGLVRICFLAQGRLTGRDAWQQALEGTEVSRDSIAPGDLVFYDRTGRGRITHVAIYAGGGRLIHCSGYVRDNALAPDAPDTLTGRVMAIRRVTGRPFAAPWEAGDSVSSPWAAAAR